MNLPASFTEYTRALLGVEEYEKLVSALQQEPPVSISQNRLKVQRLKEENALSDQGASADTGFLRKLHGICTPLLYGNAAG